MSVTKGSGGSTDDAVALATPAKGDVDFTFRVQILGGEEVGKTSFLMKATGLECPGRKPRKQPSEFETVVEIDGKRAKIILFDMLPRRGGDVFRKNVHYKKIHGVMLLADISRPDSHTSILNFYWHVKTRNKGGIPFLALGTKYDLKEKRKWSKKEAKEECECGDIRYIEICSKSGRNVDGALKLLVRNMISWAIKHRVTYETGEVENDPTQNEALNEFEDLGEGGGCCVIA